MHDPMTHREPPPIALKKIAFLAPRSGLSRDEFCRYWRDVHGSVVAGSPGYARYRRRYVQNHVAQRGPLGRPFAFGGIAAFWLPDQESNEEEFARSAIYRHRIRPDEENFIDMDRTLSMTATEQIARPGNAAVKLIVVSRRAEGLAQADFQDSLRSRIPIALDASAFGKSLRGWTLNHLVEGSFRRPGARPIDPIDIDCVQELWFDSMSAASAALTSVSVGAAAPFGADLCRPDALSSFFAEEIVFFDANGLSGV